MYLLQKVFKIFNSPWKPVPAPSQAASSALLCNLSACRHAKCCTICRHPYHYFREDMEFSRYSIDFAIHKGNRLMNIRSEKSMKKLSVWTVSRNYFCLAASRCSILITAIRSSSSSCFNKSVAFSYKGRL